MVDGFKESLHAGGVNAQKQNLVPIQLVRTIWEFLPILFTNSTAKIRTKNSCRYHGKFSGSLSTFERTFWFKALMASMSSSEIEKFIISRFSAK